MAYKNSGAMKFNDATDLVIRADPDGTVESVYNLADNAEYVGAYSPAVNVTLIINSESASARTVYFAAVDANGTIAVNNVSINAGASRTLSAARNVDFYTSAACSFELVSGDATISNNHLIVHADSTVKIVDI